MPSRSCVFVLCLLLSAAGCSNQPNHEPIGPQQLTLSSVEGEVASWDFPVKHLPGEIQVRTHQGANNSWQLRFLENPSQTHYYPLKITVSDDDCDFGHKVIVEYFPDKRTMYREYFETIIPWGEELRLSVAWDHENIFTVSANGELFKSEVYDSFSSFSLKSTRAAQDIFINYTADESAN